MADALGPALGVRLELGELTEEERAMTKHLVERKYSQDSWNLLR
jgi:lipoate-protein ligase A